MHRRSRGEFGRALELLGGVLGVELHARATGEHQQLDVLGRTRKARERRLAALAVLAGPQVGVRALCRVELIDRSLSSRA